MIEIDWDKTIEALEFVLLCQEKQKINMLKKCFKLHSKIKFNGCAICDHKDECLLAQFK